MTNSQTTFIAFMDNKLDDKVAFWHLFKYGGYAKHIVVLSNLTDMVGACSDLHDFMCEMGEVQRKNMIVLSGYQSPKKAPHEATFIRSRHKALDGAFSINTVCKHVVGSIDVLQSAPTPREHITMLIDSPCVQIKTYHAIHGFNTDQGTHETTLKWLVSLKSMIQKTHPSGEVRFTNNFASFQGNPGAHQPYDALKALVPLTHLEAALDDPFVGRQLEISYNIIKNVLGEKLLTTALVPNGCLEADLYKLTLIARKNETPEAATYRMHYIDLIDNTLLPGLDKANACYTQQIDELQREIESLDPNNTDLAALLSIRLQQKRAALEEGEIRRFRIANGVRAAFINQLHVELCDANHVVAAMAADGRFGERYINHKWTPMEFTFNEKGTIVFKDTQCDGHGLTLNNLLTTDILQIMQALHKEVQ